MSIKAVYESISQSALYKLKYNGKILGMRAKIYNRDTKSFDYFDFATSLISNANLQNFLKNNQSKFESLDLIEFKTTTDNQDGTITELTTLMTQEEVDSKQQIKEFKSKREAEETILRLEGIYTARAMEE